MSILIRGMEMPTTCGNCWFCHAVSNEKWHCRLTGKSFASYSAGWGNENNTGENGQHPYIRRDDCPLVPVPPHGRLGDLDEINEKHDKLSRDFCHGYFKSTWDFVCAARKIFYDAPTIIPAEGKPIDAEFWGEEYAEANGFTE